MMANGIPQAIVISGPSGSGKTTLVKKLMAEFDGYFAFSVSHTTRKPRPGEEHGKDYYYIELDEMKEKIKNKDFVEHIEFAGNLYGTSKQAIQDVEATGRICILDVDMQGVKNIKATNINPKYIFCQAPSMEILEQRLRGRSSDTEESIQKRLSLAKLELDFGAEEGNFDYKLVNDDLEVAYEELKEILRKDIENIQKAAKTEAVKSNGKPHPFACCIFL